MTEAPRFTVEKVSVPLGAGIWIKRWVVLQDDAIKDWFVNPNDAQVFVSSQERNWQSHDE